MSGYVRWGLLFTAAVAVFVFCLAQWSAVPTTLVTSPSLKTNQPPSSTEEGDDGDFVEARFANGLLHPEEPPVSMSPAQLRAYSTRWGEIFHLLPGEVPDRLPEDVVGASSVASVEERSPDVTLSEDPPYSIPRVSKKLHLTVCILATPMLVYDRLLPLITTSLVNAQTVYVFFRKTNVSHAAVAAVEGGLRAAQAQGVRFDHVHVVELDGPNAANIHTRFFVRNSWMDMEVVSFLGRELFGPLTPVVPQIPTDMRGRWFTIIDDDSYLLMPAVRVALYSATQTLLTNKSMPTSPHTTLPLVVGKLMSEQRKGIRKLQIGARRVTVPRSRRPPEQFAAGGAGISFNIAALGAIYTKSVFHPCIAKYMHGGGDVRISRCLFVEGRASFVTSDCFSWDTPMRALGEQQLNRTSPYPCSFHRMRKSAWYFRLGAVERARHPQLVTWGDLQLNFKPPHFWDSHFYPRRYANFSEIYFALTKADLARLNRKRGLPVDEDP